MAKKHFSRAFRAKTALKPDHAQVSLRHQRELVGLNRVNWYAQARQLAIESEANLLIDKLYMAYSFFGSRKLTAVLRREGQSVNRIQRLMGYWLDSAQAHHQPGTSASSEVC